MPLKSCMEAPPGQYTNLEFLSLQPYLLKLTSVVGEALVVICTLTTVKEIGWLAYQQYYTVVYSIMLGSVAQIPSKPNHNLINSYY